MAQDSDLIDWLNDAGATDYCPVCNACLPIPKLQEHVERCLDNPPAPDGTVVPAPTNPFAPNFPKSDVGLAQKFLYDDSPPNPFAPSADPSPAPAPSPVPVPSPAPYADIPAWQRNLEAEEAENYRKLLALLEAEKEAESTKIPEDNTTFRCLVCKVPKDPATLTFLENCSHTFCRECLVEALMTKINAGKPSEIRCPECDQSVLPMEIKACLQADQFEQFEKASLKEVLSNSAKFITCPNEECGEVIEALATPSKADYTEKGEDGRPLSREAAQHKAAHRFRCRSCSTIFCSECRVTPYHLGYTCQQFSTYQKAKHCRFCGAGLKKDNTAPSTGTAALEDCCRQPECLAKRAQVCSKTLACGHYCGGLVDESKCLPCLDPECAEKANQPQNGEDFCNICWVEDLNSAPAIQLQCGHVFHSACVLKKIQNKWPYSRIIFSFMECPLCHAWMKHPAIRRVSKPILELHEEIKKKGLERMQALNLMKTEDVMDPKSKWYKDPSGYAMYRFSYFPCHKCKKPYYGGEKVCEAAVEEDYNPAELVCGNCSDFAALENCPTHGKDYIEYKCRFCCNVAVWFCFGTTHFCEPCHKKAGTIVKVAKNKLPACNCQFKHPPNGEEFLLGCSLCRLSKHSAFN